MADVIQFRRSRVRLWRAGSMTTPTQKTVGLLFGCGLILGGGSSLWALSIGLVVALGAVVSVNAERDMREYLKEKARG